MFYKSNSRKKKKKKIKPDSIVLLRLQLHKKENNIEAFEVKLLLPQSSFLPLIQIPLIFSSKYSYCKNAMAKVYKVYFILWHMITYNSTHEKKTTEMALL